jgi:hypothetical protein
MALSVLFLIGSRGSATVQTLHCAPAPPTRGKFCAFPLPNHAAHIAVLRRVGQVACGGLYLSLPVIEQISKYDAG